MEWANQTAPVFANESLLHPDLIESDSLNAVLVPDRCNNLAKRGLILDDVRRLVPEAEVSKWADRASLEEEWAEPDF
ncbi:hypothetical protein TorRG33x02_081430 [Trema orientale]|uniref:Uncharacterized protein n=1 Tax=Trema orientale TaxID=63057 RepID=A0A2P5FEI7_TREOI|nr:hypothetical protein TorRG33x02_081430 [Trema orientale]